MRFGVLVSCFVLLTSATAHAEQSLTTPDFRITLTSNCTEGVVACDNVTYHGINRKTGAAITLEGAINRVACADGKTPCHIGNYRFKNNAAVYTVYPNGKLIVTQGGRVRLSETGRWTYQAR